MVDRKRDKDYKQICAHLPISLIRRFKGLTVSKDLKQGDAVEQAIELWVKLEGGKVEPKLEDDSKEELVSFLRLLSTGEKPNDTKCCLVAHEAGMQAEDIMRIRDKLFGARNGNEATH